MTQAWDLFPENLIQQDTACAARWTTTQLLAKCCIRPNLPAAVSTYTEKQAPQPGPPQHSPPEIPACRDRRRTSFTSCPMM
jgi:hypothetical protein